MLDHDDEQEWIKNHHHVIQDDSISTYDYLTKVYEHLVRRRYEERRVAAESSDITNNDNVKTSSNCWEVFFKIPDQDNNNQGGMKKFFLKIHNSDVICVHQPEHSIDTPKLKFLHSLIGCQFLVKTTTNIAGKRKSVTPGGMLMDSRQSMVCDKDHHYHQIQIKLSEKHKRVFFVENEDLAQEIVRKMKKVADIRDLDDNYDFIDKT